MIARAFAHHLTEAFGDEAFTDLQRFRWPLLDSDRAAVAAEHAEQAERRRLILMHEMADYMKDLDMYVSGSGDVGLTNQTGHPAVVALRPQPVEHDILITRLPAARRLARFALELAAD